MNRRNFSKDTALGLLSLAAWGSIGCGQSNKTSTSNMPANKDPFFKLSLAQWSLNRAIRGGDLDPFAFASKAKELGFEGLEYVSQLYKEFYADADNTLLAVKGMGNRFNSESKKHGLENLIIMVDGEGDLGIKDKAKRLEGVSNHHKWVDLAKDIGCHSIRINLFGDGTKEEQVDNAADSMVRLGDYAKDLGVNILVENHGGFSSDPAWVVDVMKKANRSNVGTLPDFGNFCIARENGERWGAPCVNEYKDYYKAVEMMMPYAKAVSAKSYNFDDSGDETKIDYYKMMKVIKEANYKGYIGVEYEGEAPEEEGILATKKLLLKAAKTV